MDPLKMYFLLKMGIFHCYVSLLEGKETFDRKNFSTGQCFALGSTTTTGKLRLITSFGWPRCAISLPCHRFITWVSVSWKLNHGRNMCGVATGEIGFWYVHWWMFQGFLKKNICRNFPTNIYFKEGGPRDESVLGNFLRVLECVSVVCGFLRIGIPWDETHHEIRHH